jgi:mxaL protein
VTPFEHRDARFWLLLAAFIAACLALTLPDVTQRQDTYDIIAVLDITGSMNTRDMEGPDGSAQSRLAAARSALEQLASRLPCQSRFGLGLFTERRSFLLFESVPVCENYDAIVGALSAVDSRMAWEGDSYIAKGLYSAIELAASLKSDVIFITDGHEAPPLPASGLPPFEGKRGEVKGLIAGVGSDVKSPIPKFDDEGREVGVYGPQDVPQVNHFGLPPAGAEMLPGWHPRNAPFGGQTAVGDEHLSSLREEHLQKLADATGLSYVRLAGSAGLFAFVREAMSKRSVAAATDIGVYPAIVALTFLAAVYLLSLRALFAARTAFPFRRKMKGSL